MNSSGVLTLYVDGVASSTATASGNWTSAGEIAIAGGAVDASNFFDGLLPEFGVATGFTNSTVAGQLDTYLKNKWGL
jgi:hypothetical protein